MLATYALRCSGDMKVADGDAFVSLRIAMEPLGPSRVNVYFFFAKNLSSSKS